MNAVQLEADPNITKFLIQSAAGTLYQHQSKNRLRRMVSSEQVLYLSRWMPKFTLQDNSVPWLDCPNFSRNFIENEFVMTKYYFSSLLGYYWEVECRFHDRIDSVVYLIKNCIELRSLQTFKKFLLWEQNWTSLCNLVHIH